LKKKSLLSFIGVVGIVGIILFGCTTNLDSPTGPSNTPPTETNIGVNSGSSGGSGVVETSAEQDCALIQIKRSEIVVEVECLTIRVFVPAAFADYVKLWTPDRHESLLKQCPVNDWCEYTFNKPGTYQIRFDVEKKKDDGTVWQCDRHKETVTVKNCPSGCTQPPKPEGNCEYDPSDCTWDCLSCPTTYECGDCQVWNPRTCACEGECPPCEPVGEKECSEQVWSGEPLCQWVGDCICDPEGKPECPEQEWDTSLCQWIGECPCEPIDKPECEGQEWDYDLCQYIGQCDFDCPTYEVPVVWCHVSSKKNGGINESTMSNNTHIPPGHCMHFDPTKWCPPDYLGECDGRSFTYQCIN
jgi:surface-anchored protein